MTGENPGCPVCGSPNATSIIKIPEVPVYCNWLLSKREDALNAPKGNIDLVFCSRCGHVFNMDFDPELMAYTQDYENSLHFSPRFQEYARILSQRLTKDYNLLDKNIIDIGCGKGDFLKMLCDAGNNSGVGFDPSYEPGRMEASNPSGGQLTIIRDYFSEKYADYQADLISCRHVLEHIQKPQDFLNSLKRTIGSRTDTVLFFEVPNVLYTLRDLGIWDLIYEHCSYFSRMSLSYLFNSCGFRELHLSEAFGGQFLSVDARLSGNRNGENVGNRWDGFVTEMSEYVSVFAEHYYEKIDLWGKELAGIETDDKKAVVWGAGSKGVTFLNTLRTKDQVEYVVDINPHKQGKYVVGTGQRIISPVFLKEYQPDVIFIMNAIYLNEIDKTVSDLGLTSKIVAV